MFNLKRINAAAYTSAASLLLFLCGCGGESENSGSKDTPEVIFTRPVLKDSFFGTNTPQKLKLLPASTSGRKSEDI